jgi:hypothetical protein
MRNFLFILGVFISINVFALPPLSNWQSHQAMYGISAGKYYTDFSMLNSQMKLWGTTKQFTNYNYAIGLEYKIPTLANFNSFELFIPQKINTVTSDSLSFKMSGWHNMTSTFGLDLIPSDAIALVVSSGVDWGNVILKRTLLGTSTKYKNPFFAPLAKVDLRFILGKIAIGGRAIYRYDVTNDIWKRKADLLPVLPGTKMRGFAFQFFIGYGLIWN